MSVKRRKISFVSVATCPVCAKSCTGVNLLTHCLSQHKACQQCGLQVVAGHKCTHDCWAKLNPSLTRLDWEYANDIVQTIMQKSNTHTCSTCNVRCPSSSSLREHQEAKHFWCPQCQQWLQTWTVTHAKACNLLVFPCPKCEFVGSTRPLLQEHQATSHFLSLPCNHSFATRASILPNLTLH